MAEIHRRMRPLLGTYVEIGVSHAESSAIDRAFAAIEQVQRLLSFHDPESELSRLNAAQGDELELHPISVRVLHLARLMMKASFGLFNCTMGAGPDEAGQAGDIEIQGRKVRLRRPFAVTLDGIAKGYAVDLAVKELKSCGVASGWVNAGGDLRVFGELTVPIQRRLEDGFEDLGFLTNAALATSKVSADFEPSFPGKIVGHGQAAPQPGTWSVLARRAWLADALTKVACLARPEERSHRIQSLGGHLIEGLRGAAS